MKQQWGLLVGVTVSTIAIGATLNLMNTGLQKYIPTQIPVNVQELPTGVKVERESFTYQGKTYDLINALGSRTIPDGEYLYDPGTKQIEMQWVQGIGSDKAPAPQARLMATVINGILNQRLPWRLVLMGVALVLAVEILECDRWRLRWELIFRLERRRQCLRGNRALDGGGEFEGFEG